ncbi:MAG: PCMD domain-containing protein [Chitinophagales bacterium]|nr:PCMD domain-containing protein [Chitinophagales bacterium]MCZ2392484.1 PCMD domain-containing protein [Chitinophagales bacterium]
MRLINVLKFCALILVGSIVFVSCKKDTKETPSKECKETPTGNLFSDIPNLSFNDWYSGKGPGTVYDEPSPKEFWATSNRGSGDLTIAIVPVTVFKELRDSATGDYAVRLTTGETKLVGKKAIVAGSVASGVFEPNLTNPLASLKFGKKFEKRPKKVSGEYKYLPVLGDSASAYCFVTKMDANCKIDTLGFGRKIFYNEQSDYGQFEFDVVYKSSEKPDRIVIYFSSSEAGDSFAGQLGNTLYIDNVKVEYY